VTGSTQVPLGGFAHLQGHEGPLWFTITKVQNTSALPTASTWYLIHSLINTIPKNLIIHFIFSFNLLKLPEYKSEEELCKCLYTAIIHGSSGFDFN
jgi:hypothetical protein